MEIKEREIDFLNSVFDLNGRYLKTEQVLSWIAERRKAISVEISLIPFARLDKWFFHDQTGNLQHESGKFFSIEGIEIRTNRGPVSTWTQPIINQPEIGYLGIIAKKIDGILHFLMQAKIEPGNIDFVQISPTLQATKSNYSRVHNGKSPLYVEYFFGDRKRKVLIDQLQSEQGARFFKKRNRNIIVEVDEDIPVHEDFCWLTLGQLKLLMRHDNLVNMDTRTVLSGISYGTFQKDNIESLERLFYARSAEIPNDKAMLLSAIDDSRSLNTFEDIISWITSLKCTYELEVKKIPLRQVNKWIKTDTDIHHEQNKYFSVIAAGVHISNREVIGWSQPLIQSAQEGLIAFIVKKIKGAFHFLVQAKIEAGSFDILELAPTVQCLTGNYRKGLNEYEVPFINEVLEAPAGRIIYKTMQSEEGGRFYREQNLNIIVEVDGDFPEEVPEGFCWLTLNQLYAFNRFNNYLNIQARSLLAAVTF